MGDPAFDRVFRVSARDPSYALELLVPDVRAALLRRPDVTWRVDRDAVLAIRVGQHDADDIEPLLRVLQDVVTAIPDPVRARVRDHG